MDEMVTELPPLTEAMSARDLIAHRNAIRDIWPGGDVFLSFIDSGPYVSFYSRGEKDNSFYGETWPEVITKAHEFIASHATVARDNRIRAMALAIIDLTDKFGRCYRAMLTRRDFTAQEVEALSEAACQRAGELANNAPFSVQP